MTGWRERAECRNYDPDFWHPQPGPQRRRAVTAAMTVCRTKCAVDAECAAYILGVGKGAGVWAGVDLGDAVAALSAAEKKELNAIVEEGKADR